MNKYRTLNELIIMIDEPNRSICNKLLLDNVDIIAVAKGSKHNHQAWIGGYIDHVEEVMNYAVTFYDTLNDKRPLPFSLSDALLVLYLHDLEKPWKHILKNDGSWDTNRMLMDDKYQIRPFVEQKIKEYGFQLTKDHMLGLQYVEGEKGDHSNDERKQTPLAAFAHICDTVSARIYYDYPKEYKDGWKSTGNSI